MAEAFLVQGSVEILKRLSLIVARTINPACTVDEEFLKLQQTIKAIQAVLVSAEKKQVNDRSIRLWLKRLKDTASEAENIFDEFSYVEAKQQPRSKIRNYISRHNPAIFCFEMGQKIKKINSKFDDIAKEKNAYNFNVTNCFSTEEVRYNRETYSHLDFSSVVGREADKSRLVDKLINFNNEQPLSVTAIVGMGGIGKTTLAKLVYNDKTIMSHFNKLMWVHVFQVFDVNRLVGDILSSASGKIAADNSSLEFMLKQLQDVLRGKKFLLVLDNVWSLNDAGWEVLNNALRGQMNGSKILVTTRNDDVTSVMRTYFKHAIQKLSEEECWDIFRKIAHGEGGARATTSLENIGRDLVRKCKGIPLAAWSLGCLMHSKREEQQWISIRNSEIFDVTENGILRALKLSYNQLPPPVKLCFSYCSVFPKSSRICKTTLIQLWMAEGLLQPEDMLLEDVGCIYFNILLKNHFFCEPEMSISGDIECKMHDFFHDLAQHYSGDECFKVSKMSNISETRRAAVGLDQESQIVPEELYKAKWMRTFLMHSALKENVVSISDNLFLKFKFLRVLDLSHSAVTSLPDSVGKLIYLRYLDLSWSAIEELPSAITSLFNLQTLKLKFCNKLKKLPSDLTRLIKLRHLELDDTTLIEMPEHVGKLTSLQTLPIFIIGKGKGRTISELQNLNLLKGLLEISGLENVEDFVDAEKAKLKEKANIRNLRLRWSMDGHEKDHLKGKIKVRKMVKEHLKARNYHEKSDADELYNDEKVEDGLQPHPNLEVLMIDNFMGNRSISWLSHLSLPNLIEISLLQCNQCEYLPTLGFFPLLKTLTLEKMRAFKHLGYFHGNSSTSTRDKEESRPRRAFCKLEELRLVFLPSLENWVEPEGLAKLRILIIKDCHKLVSTPKSFPCLEELLISDSNPEAVMSVAAGNLTHLHYLQIMGISNLTNLPQSLLPRNLNLSTLIVLNCPDLRAFPCEELKQLACLRRLIMGGFWNELTSYPFPNDGIAAATYVQQHLLSLKELEIVGWSSLLSLPAGLQCLTTLERLKISRFPELRTLPEMGRLAKLQRLIISACPYLKIIRLKDCSSEWHKISHIPNIVVDDEEVPTH